ncbi:integrin beta-6-like [Anticarsia gemmatalis]|uniref:integrin beta-6-like n=1 Tax=Anticarsia gemmatalis TaxID=129554 RepID=UPI003F77555D
MSILHNTIFISCFFIVVNGMTRGQKFIMDERFVCTVKTSCLECLKLPHCSWCESENKCFSKQLTGFEEFCSNNTVDHEDFGFSFAENAECSCSRDDVEQRCYPPGVTTGAECSGRGTCVCGQCVCNKSDPREPTKMIMGEFCEFDNFSCEGPKCNEGPYSISGPTTVEDGSTKPSDVDIPAS